jgi:hypothetical protein
MTRNVIERQHPAGAMCDLRIANLGAENGYTIAIPIDAVLVRVVVLTVTAFDSGTTATVTVTDGTTVFANGVDVKTTGSETVANTPKYYASGGTLAVTAAETGTTATAGRVLVLAEYYILGNGNAGIYHG